MNSRISELLEEIRGLEEELEDAIKTHEVEFLYRFEGTKVKFEQAVEQAHRKLKVGIFPLAARKSTLQCHFRPLYLLDDFPSYLVGSDDLNVSIHLLSVIPNRKG